MVPSEKISASGVTPSPGTETTRTTGAAIADHVKAQASRQADFMRRKCQRFQHSVEQSLSGSLQAWQTRQRRAKIAPQVRAERFALSICKKGIFDDRRFRFPQLQQKA